MEKNIVCATEKGFRYLKDWTNAKVIVEYLKYYRHSEESMSTRKHSLKYFFGKLYFGYDKGISKITKHDLIDYFDYLNNKNDIVLNTKKVRWAILKGFLRFCMEYFDDFVVVVPKYIVKWKLVHKESESNKDVVLNRMEVEKILYWLKENNYKYYIIFKLFAETGMRKGELINIICKNVDLEKRSIKTLGKSGRVVYWISKEMGGILEGYIEERERTALFSLHGLKKYSARTFNLYLKSVLSKIGIEKNVTCKTFRSTINTLRKLMGCPLEERKMLLNHKVIDVNTNHYVKFSHSECIELYDKWNPFKKGVVKGKMDVIKCVYERNCVSMCNECEIDDYSQESCDICSLVCGYEGDYEICGYYETMEAIREAEGEAGIKGGCVVDMEQHRIFLEKVVK